MFFPQIPANFPLAISFRDVGQTGETLAIVLLWMRARRTERMLTALIRSTVESSARLSPATRRLLLEALRLPAPTE